MRKRRKVPSVGKFKRRSFKIKFKPIFFRNSFWDSKFPSFTAYSALFKEVTKSLASSNQELLPAEKSYKNKFTLRAVIGKLRITVSQIYIEGLGKYDIIKYNITMKVNRNKTYLGKISKNDEGFVGMSPAERISFMWELTAELWSLRKSPYVERRLQRNITNLIKQ